MFMFNANYTYLACKLCRQDGDVGKHIILEEVNKQGVLNPNRLNMTLNFHENILFERRIFHRKYFKNTLLTKKLTSLLAAYALVAMCIFMTNNLFNFRV